MSRRDDEGVSMICPRCKIDIDWKKWKINSVDSADKIVVKFTCPVCGYTFYYPTVPINALL